MKNPRPHLGTELAELTHKHRPLQWGRARLGATQPHSLRGLDWGWDGES